MAAAPGVEKVLVTGASGYIATHVVKQLQEAGYQVRGTVRSLTNPKKVNPLKELCPNAAHELELVEADLTNAECWQDAVRGCTHVLHTASPFPAANPRDENELIKPAVEGTTRILQACVDVGGVKRVVVTSSVAAISDLMTTNEVPIDESVWRDTNSPNCDAYAKSKTFAEKAAWEFMEKLPGDAKFELATINPSLVLGPVLCGAPGTSVEVVKRLLERNPPLVPRINFPICDVRDVAKAHIIAMTLPEAVGHRHIISPYNLWMLEMSKILNAELQDKGYKAATTVPPNFLVKMFGTFDPSVKLVAKMLGCQAKLDDTRMRQVLGIDPFDPKDSLIDMAYTCIDRGFIVRKKGYYHPEKKKSDGEAGGASTSGQASGGVTGGATGGATGSAADMK